tara:strand:+ start:388 stop:507 length:120 start_codon:yes stop_codon:yes gene_type:complete
MVIDERKIPNNKTGKKRIFSLFLKACMIITGEKKHKIIK